jgi:hypothetical protein
VAPLVSRASSPFDPLVKRKIGAPTQEELAVNTSTPTRVTVMAWSGVKCAITPVGFARLPEAAAVASKTVAADPDPVGPVGP